LTLVQKYALLPDEIDRESLKMVEASLPDSLDLTPDERFVVCRIVRAEGPERLAPEWWRRIPLAASPPGNHTRDYYRAEDGDGRRFWLYREGLYGASATPPRWYLHGVFA